MKNSLYSVFIGQLLCLMVVLCFCAAPAITMAELSSVGLYYGRSLGGNDFNQFDLHASIPFPWEKQLSSNWLLHADVEGIVSMLEHQDKALKPSLMSNLLFSSPGKKLDIITGLGLGVMFGDTSFRDDESNHDLGGPFFLQGQVGIRVYVTDHIFAGCRYYHQSNAGIYEQNDSVNLGQLEVGWRF